MSHPAASSPDYLERFFQRLVENLASLDPGALHRPVVLGEIHERLVPYRTHRAALGVDTNEDYEMTVLRLLSGERGFAQVFPDDVAAALAREAASPNPDTGLFRQFPDATVLLDADRIADMTAPAASGRRADERDPTPAALPRSAPPDEEGGEPDDPVAGEPDDDEADAAREPLPFSLEEDAESVPVAARPREITVSAPCSYCGGNLPVGRTVLFCPHCGQNIGVVHCPTCGSELDVGWTFCITCGQKVTGIG